MEAEEGGDVGPLAALAEGFVFAAGLALGGGAARPL
eukprot:CAMPEP_0182474764 /NCGR_PEP_ID=MMETSP1319-20130603/26247_1 /TAXON_ID=172717 /ORGANISM="Bolidomonas pacifica, Strain RCC208" /LENGTH=35 /DNA_ID= /DNA_START= /DNA_END= /DNA_ORIENTATION=